MCVGVISKCGHSCAVCTKRYLDIYSVHTNNNNTCIGYQSVKFTIKGNFKSVAKSDWLLENYSCHGSCVTVQTVN